MNLLMNWCGGKKTIYAVTRLLNFTFPLLIACPHYMTYDFQEYYYCTDLRKVRINEPTRISWNETDGFVWVNHLL